MRLHIAPRAPAGPDRASRLARQRHSITTLLPRALAPVRPCKGRVHDRPQGVALQPLLHRRRQGAQPAHLPRERRRRGGGGARVRARRRVAPALEDGRRRRPRVLQVRGARACCLWRALRCAGVARGARCARTVGCAVCTAAACVPTPTVVLYARARRAAGSTGTTRLTSRCSRSRSCTKRSGSTRTRTSSTWSACWARAASTRRRCGCGRPQAGRKRTAR